MVGNRLPPRSHVVDLLTNNMVEVDVTKHLDFWSPFSGWPGWSIIANVDHWLIIFFS